MSSKLILSNRTVNIKDTMKPCLCHEGVTVCVGHQDNLKQIADKWNNHDQLTDAVERLREENAKLTKNQSEIMEMIESLKDNADLTVQFGDEWEGDTQDCVTTGDLECLIEDILEMINKDTK